MSGSKESLYERLRGATRPLHDELEGAVRIGERLESPASYASHLVQLWQLHTSAETGLQALDFRPLGFVYPSPYRAALLEADLDFLGIPAARLQALPLPLAPTLPSLAAGLGCIYVVEGSAKGARAILPDIKSALGFDSEGGAAFFSGRGQGGKLLWRAFLAAIEHIPPGSEDADQAVDAAQATFAMFRAGLLEPAPEHLTSVDASKAARPLTRPLHPIRP
jgi:heme oxygenase